MRGIAYDCCNAFFALADAVHAHTCSVNLPPHLMIVTFLPPIPQNTGAPKPPTAAPGTAQPPATAPKTGASTSTAAPRTGENIVDALAGTLIKKMRNKFAMIASDNLSQVR